MNFTCLNPQFILAVNFLTFYVHQPKLLLYSAVFTVFTCVSYFCYSWLVCNNDDDDDDGSQFVSWRTVYLKMDHFFVACCCWGWTTTVERSNDFVRHPATCIKVQSSAHARSQNGLPLWFATIAIDWTQRTSNRHHSITLTVTVCVPPPQHCTVYKYVKIEVVY